MAETSHDTNGTAESLSQEAAAAAGAAAAAAAAAVAAAAAGSAAGGAPTGVAAGEKVPPPVEIKLFIGRVPQSMEEDGLRPVFEEFGEVREVIIIRDKTSGKHKNSAFVKMGEMPGSRQLLCIAARCCLPPAVGASRVDVRDSGSSLSGLLSFCLLLLLSSSAS